MNFSKSIIYQIYLKSFKDSNNDGIGDLKGVLEKLDYLNSLGVDYLWITPFFTSPQNDNGYDISDYTSIDPMFGSMKDFEELIKEANKRKIGIMLDMVFNHTSTDHIWFKYALEGNQKYMDYYIFKDGTSNIPPTNWKSKFGGSSWEYISHLKKWYLHLFDITQADLNWNNPDVRKELKDIVNFWVKKGVKGFRFDVINLISKNELFIDDDNGDGKIFYTDGPYVHKYIKELVKDTHINNLITVGEMSSTSIENCIKYSNPNENELSMCFNFHHLKVDYKHGYKWEITNANIEKLKEILITWQEKMQENNGWNALFWCNHDQPRIVSRLGDEKKYWKESAKMLATSIHLLRGTPYIYQGEEIGMTNAKFSSISQYRDVESINHYNIMMKNGKTNQESLDILNARSRDNSRTPMHWNSKINADFTNSNPWIEIQDNYKYINVEDEILEADSILNFYKKLIKIRKDKLVISDGKIEFIFKNIENVFAFRRYLQDEEIIVINNFSNKTLKFENIIFNIYDYNIILNNNNNYEFNKNNIILKPFESIIFKYK